MSEMIKNEERENISVLDLLLSDNVRNVKTDLPETRYKLKRLSEEAGRDVVFKLRGLPYGRVEELKKSKSEDVHIHTLLAGVIEPDLTSPALLAKFGGPTPADMIKGMLLPGEIEDVAIAVEKLCGYRIQTIEEVKNA